jgi:hypothetical protein
MAWWCSQGGMSGSPENRQGVAGRASRVTAKPRRSNRCTRRRWTWSRACSSQYCAPSSWEGCPRGKHVVDGDEHGVSDGDHRLPFAPARGNAPELGGEVGALHPARHVGDLGACAPQPDVAVARAATAAAATALGVTLGIPGTSRPRRPGARTPGEARHVRAARGDQHFSGAPTDAGDGREQVDGSSLVRQARCELGVNPRDGRIQVLQMSELLAQQEDVVSLLSCSRPTTARARASRLARSFPRANSASACASVSPASSRCRLSRAARPRTSVTTDASLLLASSRTACSRLVSRARASTKWIR